MNYWKKALALIMVMLIVARLLMCNVYALAGPTVIASEELYIFFTTILGGSGVHDSSEFDGLSTDELGDMLQDDLDSGAITPSTEIYCNPLDPLGSFITTTVADFMTDPETQAAYGVSLALADVYKDILKDSFLKTIIDPINLGHVDVSKKVNPTKVDSGYTALEGCGVLQQPGSNGWYYIYYGVEPGQLYYNGNEISAYIRYNHYELYRPSGDLYSSYDGEGAVNVAYKTLHDGEYVNDTGITILGSWAWREDGTEAETDDEEEYVLGEADGVPVTPDMVNADGTVTIGDTTYTPDEYVDPDALTDEAIIELLKEILNAIDNTPVVDNTDVDSLADDIAGEVEVELDKADLNNFTVPTGITSVFPFCLPFDFVRGLQLLAADPVAPVFEIPFNIPSFGLYEGTENTVTLDFAKYSKYFEVARWVQVILFSMALIFISRKLVQGVH